MKKPIWKNTLILAFSAFVVTLTPLGTARAELVSEEVQEDSISPEGSADASSDNQELVIVKKRPAARQAATRKVIRREVVEEQAEPIALQQEPAMEVRTQTQVAVPAQAERKSVGSAIDNNIQNKMDGVREQFEQALIRQLDKIKITVADEAPAAAPVQTTVVTDSVISSAAAPEKAGYMSIESAPVVADDAAENESVAKKSEESEKTSIRLSPIIGMTSLGSNYYNIEARYTAGIEIEMAMDENLAAVLGYSYSQYDISLGTANPFYAAQPQFGYGIGNNYSTLSYNQNVFQGGLRVYLTPQSSKFRPHIGAGLGYNKGYVNYNNRYANTYQYNPYQNQPDYEVTSFLGILEAGADFQVSKAVSVGALFKYDQVLSANENQPLNNYAFINQGYNGQVGDKALVGGSIAKENFYSILGTVKVAF